MHAKRLIFIFGLCLLGSLVMVWSINVVPDGAFLSRFSQKYAPITRGRVTFSLNISLSNISYSGEEKIVKTIKELTANFIQQKQLQKQKINIVKHVKPVGRPALIVKNQLDSSKLELSEIAVIDHRFDGKYRINNQNLISHHGFKLINNSSTISWVRYLENFKNRDGLNLSQQIAVLENKEKIKFQAETNNIVAKNLEFKQKMMAAPRPQLEINETVELSKTEISAKSKDSDQVSNQKLTELLENFSLENIKKDKVSVTQAKSEINGDYSKNNVQQDISLDNKHSQKIFNRRDPSIKNEYSDMNTHLDMQLDTQSVPNKIADDSIISGRVRTVIKREMKHSDNLLALNGKMNIGGSDILKSRWEDNRGRASGGEVSSAPKDDHEKLALIHQNEKYNAIHTRGKSALDQSRTILAEAMFDKSDTSPVQIQKNKIILSSLGFSLDGKSEPVNNFSFQSHFDSREFFNSNFSGEIELETLMNGRHGIWSGTILPSNDYYPTRIDLTLEKEKLGPVDKEIPLINRASLRKILDENGSRERGGHFLVKLDPDTESIDVNAKYFEAKIFLDKKLKIVDEGEEFDYILFASITPGNVLVSYELSDRSVVSKIIHIVSEEVTLDFNGFYERDRDRFTIKEENILGRKMLNLEIEGHKITNFTDGKKATKDGLKHEFIAPIVPSGTRQYLELNHLDDSIFVGKWEEETIAIPSVDFMNQTLRAMEIDNLTGRCFVQVNLDKKELEEVFLDGHGDNQGIYLKEKYLEDDGSLTGELSVRTKKIFIEGNQQGIIDIKLKYTDETEDYLHSYCSLNTYLIEQL